MNLAEELYGKADGLIVSSLLCDEGCSATILQRMGQSLLESEKVIVSPSTEQLIVLFSTPTFNKTEDEVVCVANSVSRCMKHKDILPLASEHAGYEIASRTLVSYGFFLRSLEQRWKKYGAPRPAFYKEIALKEFKKIDREDLAENFDRWVAFMNELN